MVPSSRRIWIDVETGKEHQGFLYTANEMMTHGMIRLGMLMAIIFLAL